jgi:hypothetical protein
MNTVLFNRFILSVAELEHGTSAQIVGFVAGGSIGGSHT